MKASFLTKLRDNWRAGITVGLVSIPIAISLAVASNASPLAGIITAVWAGLMASFFGGSSYNIIGPTGALAGLLAAYTIQFGPGCLPVLAILSGVLIYLAYLCQLERYLIFIPGSALHGFILGIAGMIIIGQIPAALGMGQLPASANPLAHLVTIIMHAHQLYLPALLLFAAFISGLIFCAYFIPSIPGTIILTPLGIAVGYLSQTGALPWTFQTLGTKYGAIQATIWQFPALSLRFAYLVPACSIAAISILEVLISARIADGVTKTRHHKRHEVRGLALANLAAGLAGGIPATASLARTSLNIKSGATHSMAATLSSILTIAISLLFLPTFGYLPLPVIAAILVFISFTMLETDHLLRLFKQDKKHFALAIVVAFISIYEDPAFGVLFGAVAAMLMFMERLSRGHYETIQPTTHEVAINKPDHVLVYKIKGPLAYINAQAHCEQLEQVPAHYQFIVIDMRHVHFIDPDGTDALLDTVKQLIRAGKRMLITGTTPLVEHFLMEHRVYHQLKEHNSIFATTNDALTFINKLA